MKKNTVIQKLGLGLLFLVLVSYIGYQAYRAGSQRYKTETVYPYTVTKTARVTGVALRREEVLEEQVGDGYAVYIPQDGTKVSAGSPLAEIYEGAQDADNLSRLRELESRRELLEKAQDPGTTSFAHADVLNKQIFSELSGIIGATGSHNLSQLSKMSQQLLLLMNTKQIATGRQTDFKGAIEQLRAQEEYYRGLISDEPRQIFSPKPGYFMRKIDGMENAVDLSKLGILTAQDLFELINAPVQKTQSGSVGKLMTDHNWYFAAIIPAEESSRYRVGASVTLDFHLSGESAVPAVISRVNLEKDAPDAVVVFRLNYVSAALINLRTAQADVAFTSITGLRVSDSAVRYIGLQKGVYAVIGQRLVFRPIETIYEDSGFVLCRETSEHEAGYETNLQCYDEIVIEGSNLYDNKPIG